MARNRRGKMALYEVMSKAKNKPGYKRTLDNIRTGKPSEEEPTSDNEEAVVAETAVEEDAPEVLDAQTAAPQEQEAVDDALLAVQWRRKPRIVQYNNGRVEFSVPYQVGIAAVLGVVVVMLLAFRAGQHSVVVNKPGLGSPPVVSGSGGQDQVSRSGEGVVEAVNPGKETAKGEENAGAVTSTGNNVIVLAQYHTSRDLGPVRDHFARHGIATEILQSGGVYYLVTQDRYDSFKAGSAGYSAKQRIIQVGADYKGKAPEGYESFAPHYFSDAYPKKVN